MPSIREIIEEIEQSSKNWVYKKIVGIQPAEALKGGIPKDPNYTPRERFFTEGKAKNSPIEIVTPNLKVDTIKDKHTGNILEKVGIIDALLGGKVIGSIDTPDQKLSPAELYDQYLEDIEGGKNGLLAEIGQNYQRDKENLPWKMDPANRNKRFPVETRDGFMGYFEPNGEIASIGIGKGDGSPHSAFTNYDTSKMSNQRRHDLLANGLPEANATLTTSEVIRHELGHAYTYEKNNLHLKERAQPINKERPYYFGLSEEYKVGALTFLNKSRQLTGKKLTDPQEIHQLFDEIESDPSILDKNYGTEESRLPRTYLLLKETNPEGAKLLREATARDCQYLAKSTQELQKVCKGIGNLEGLEKVPIEVVGATAQLATVTASGIKSTRITRLNSKLEEPLTHWDKSGQPEKVKQNNKTPNLQPNAPSIC